MANLLDQLTKGLASRKATQTAPQQKQVEDVLAAKSGKVGSTSGGPSGSSLAENQVISQANTAGQQLQAQGVNTASTLQDAGAQIAEQDRQATAGLKAGEREFSRGLANEATGTREEIASREDQVLSQLSAEEMRKTTAINSAADNKLKELAAQRQSTVDGIFSEFERSNKDLAFRKDAAELEQLGFLMALGDQAYMDEIQSVARENNLMDELAYKEEMLDLTLGANFSSFLDQLGFRERFNEQGRLNQNELAQIDLNAALGMAMATTKDANNQAITQGAIDAGKAGVDWYSKQPETLEGADAPTTDATNVGTTGRLAGST